MMWDRDLEALSKGLDEIDAIEAEELEAGNIAAAGRRKHDASRQAARGATRRPAGPPRVRGGGKRAMDDDAAMLSRPLQAGPEVEGNSVPEIVKTTWGTGAPKTRTNTHSDPEEEAAPAQKVPRRVAGGGARGGSGGPPRGRPAQPAAEGGLAAAADKAPSPPKLPQEESGHGLLSRLLSKKLPDDPNSSAPPTRSKVDLSAPTSFSSLGGSDDFFSYLRTGGTEEGKPYNALDFGPPPCLSAGGTSEVPAATMADGEATGEGGAEGKKPKRRKVKADME